MIGQLQGKVALITGAGSGIGRATALVFAREGVKVVVADIDVDNSRETVNLIREADGEATFVKTDVAKETEVQKLIEKIINIYGRLDCAHNNAGIIVPPVGITKTLAECTIEEWDHTIDTNLKGVWLCMKYELIHMMEHGGGSIVNTASASGLSGSFGAPAPYTASKHGVIGLTKTAAVEYAKKGIRINAVCPGSIRTPMSPVSEAESQEHARQLGLALYPIGRRGKPQEVAEAVAWLCSNAASYITGCVLPVDGGWTA